MNSEGGRRRSECWSLGAGDWNWVAGGEAISSQPSALSHPLRLRSPDSSFPLSARGSFVNKTPFFQFRVQMLTNPRLARAGLRHQ